MNHRRLRIAAIADSPRKRRAVWALLAVALALRLAAVEWALGRGAGHQLADTEMYSAYADALSRRLTFEFNGDGALRTPGYPAFLALLGKLSGGESLRMVLTVQAVLSTLSCWLVYDIALRMGRGGATGAQNQSSEIGFAALACNVFDPYSIVQATLALTETLYTFLQLACLALGCRLLDAAPWRNAALVGWGIGVSAGLAVLVRPSALLLALLAWLVWVGYSRHRPRKIVAILVACVGFFLVLSPWWIRNWQRYGVFVPTTLNVGESLYDGLNPSATGGSDMAFTRTPATAGMNEMQRDRYWWSQAIAFARENPGRAVELAAIKFARFWSPWPNESRFRSPAVVLATALATVPVWVLAMVGLWRNRRQTAFVWVCLLPAAYFCALHLAFVSSVRYRIPVEPFLTIAAGAGLAWVTQWLGWSQRWEQNDRSI